MRLWPERWAVFLPGESDTSTGEVSRAGRKLSRALPQIARNTELTIHCCHSWIFAIEGIFTVIVGVTAYWWVPGYPKDATFLNEREHAILIDRLRKGSDSADNEPFNWAGVCTCETEGTQSEGLWLTLDFRFAGDAFKDPWVIGYGMLFHFFAFTLCPSFASSSDVASAWEMCPLLNDYMLCRLALALLADHHRPARLRFVARPTDDRASLCGRLCLHHDLGMGLAPGPPARQHHRRSGSYCHRRLHRATHDAHRWGSIRRRLYRRLRDLFCKR